MYRHYPKFSVTEVRGSGQNKGVTRKMSQGGYTETVDASEIDLSTIWA
jgi:nitrogen regulatory protein PII